MTSQSTALADLRQDLERLVSDLFENDSRGAIPPLEIERRDDQLVISATIPGAAADDGGIAVEVRLARCRARVAAHSTPRKAASASMTAPPAVVPATAA